ncbi:hypothetical protein ENUP19_0158G0033 [Entamoeba nuttalli]|uniref:Trichohyalin n=1 Tax=Entamoeba nuttalli TaxID=412467 RepID=A0ABQ0DLD5_9EUKA
MIEIQNQEYWKKLFEEEIQILTPQEVEEIKNTKIKEYTSSTIWRRWYFLAREKTKTIRKEEETISMTMEEDNNQYNPIEIKDNRIYNNHVMSIESEEDDDKDSTRVEAMLAEEKKRLEEEEKRLAEEKKRLVEEEKRLAEEKKRFTKGEKKRFTKEEKKRLVEKEEENSKKEKRIKEIEEKVEEDMKEKEEMKKEIQIKDQTIKKLTKDIMALKKKHENEMSTKNHECDKKIFKFHAESERKMSEVNNLTQQLLFLKDKLSKLENKKIQRKKRRKMR